MKYVNRCNETKNLEVHHLNRNGKNELQNALVLCQNCHENTASYGVKGNSPVPFSEEIKNKAFERAGNRCECTKLGCH